MRRSAQHVETSAEADAKLSKITSVEPWMSSRVLGMALVVGRSAGGHDAIGSVGGDHCAVCAACV